MRWPRGFERRWNRPPCRCWRLPDPRMQEPPRGSCQGQRRRQAHLLERWPSRLQQERILLQVLRCHWIWRVVLDRSERWSWKLEGVQQCRRLLQLRRLRCRKLQGVRMQLLEKGRTLRSGSPNLWIYVPIGSFQEKFVLLKHMYQVYRPRHLSLAT